ncbi:MAG: hypothetical protein IPK10_01915 [Bacteroidetes bacterium]|nr:hypothetical protein [Bacteroidota bacterium]
MMNISSIKQNTLNTSLKYVRLWTIALFSILLVTSASAQRPGYLELLEMYNKMGKV